MGAILAGLGVFNCFGGGAMSGIRLSIVIADSMGVEIE
jgi:hypothetical protein